MFGGTVSDGGCPMCMRIAIFAAVIALSMMLYIRDAPHRTLRQLQEDHGFVFHHGDLVFQDLQCGPRCEAIAEITNSAATHVGVVVEDEGDFVVWEALGPVGPTPLSEWVSRAAVAIVRPEEVPSPAGLQGALEHYRGRPYDGIYQWDDEHIYCSELVAKAFADAGVMLAAPTPAPRGFGRWRSWIARQSGGRLDESTPMVTPADLLEVGHLVFSNLAPGPEPSHPNNAFQQ